MRRLLHHLSTNVAINEHSTIHYNDKDYKVIYYDVMKEPVSVYYPLSRMLPALLVEFGRLQKPLSACHGIEDTTIQACERSLRTLALYAQVGEQA